MHSNQLSFYDNYKCVPDHIYSIISNETSCKQSQDQWYSVATQS